MPNLRQSDGTCVTFSADKDSRRAYIVLVLITYMHLQGFSIDLVYPCVLGFIANFVEPFLLSPWRTGVAVSCIVSIEFFLSIWFPWYYMYMHVILVLNMKVVTNLLYSRKIDGELNLAVLAVGIETTKLNPPILFSLTTCNDLMHAVVLLAHSALPH